VNITKEKQFIFLIGAPRSGTTMLFNSISAHPSVSSANIEINLFSDYIAPLVGNYEKEEDKSGERGGGVSGLPLLISREKFDDSVMNLIDTVYKSFNISPAHTVVLDKCPSYSQCTGLINYYVPNAKYIHIIRDGRDMAFSWYKLAATGWLKKDFKTACLDWIRLKNLAKTARKFNENYYELHYEDLLHNSASELNKVFAFCKLDASLELVQSIVEKNMGEKNMVSASDSSVSFKDRVSGDRLWAKRMSKMQVFIAQKYLTTDLIAEGYEKNKYWGLNPFQNFMYSIIYFLRNSYAKAARISNKIARKLT
jgi:sulfotransferase family protein